MLRRLRSLLAALRRAGRLDTEMDAEISFHLERLTEDLVRRGMEPDEARRQARIRFGSPERAKELTRSARGLALFDEAGRNVRFALRGLARNPLFSVTSVVTLALCIGLGAAVFSVVDAVLWKPLPYPHPNDLALAALYSPAHGKPRGQATVDGRTWERIRDAGGPFESAVYASWISGVNLSTPRTAAFVQQQRIGAGYFRTLGVGLQLGRGFRAAEEIPGGPAVAILSHRLWVRTFGADPHIVGQVIRLKGRSYTVVGVTPAGFRSEADVWTPLQPTTTGEGGGTNYEVLVRIPPGMSFREADARFASITPPTSSGNVGQRRFGLVPYSQALEAGTRTPMLILLGAIGLMLLIGCANLAGLQIGRSLARQPEIATRQALGGGTGALVRQMLTENVLLGLLGGLAGIAVAWGALHEMSGLVRSYFFFMRPIGMNGAVLASVLGLTVLATLLFGLAPVLRVADSRSHRLLVSGSRGVVGGGGHVLRKGLLVGEVAMVTVLLFSAGLLVRSYGYLRGLEPGFDPRGVLTVQFSLNDARYTTVDSVRDLFRETLRGLRAIPGVTSAAVALTLPYERPLELSFRILGQGPNVHHPTSAVYVTPGFFRTLKIPLLSGRRLDDEDRAGAPVVAVANEAFVKSYLKGRAALGTRLEMGYGGGNEVEVVGVVGNVEQSNAGWGPNSQPVWESPTLYLPAAQASSAFLSLVHVWFSPSWVVRASTPGADLAGHVTRVFREVAPGLPVARMASLDEIMSRAFSQPRFEAAFLFGVALFALLLSGLGLYGIVAHEVLERRAEMGLRMALGATPRGAVWTAGSTGVRLTLLGLAVGAALSVPMARVVAHLVWGVAPWDPLTLAVVVGVLALLTAVASFVPAARVGRMDPAKILREA